MILIGNLPCTVIGVTADNKNMFAASKALNVWVPYETAAGRLLGQRHLDSITVRIKDGQPSKVVEDNVNKLMLQRHGTKDFFTNNLDSIMQTVQNSTTARHPSLIQSVVWAGMPLAQSGRTMWKRSLPSASKVERTP